MPERPNILCLVSEDCPPRLGAYGDPLAHTPFIDLLAREGVTYEVACSTSPVCAPSRYAILTGQHAEGAPPAEHMTAFGPPPPEFDTYPQLLRAAGYYCTNNAKTHYNVLLDPAELWNESSPRAHWRNRPEGSPFLAVFNSMETHESCVFRDQPGPLTADDVSIPAYLPDTDGVRLALARYYNRIGAMDRALDSRFEELVQDGLLDNTIVIYHSDHGSPLPRSKRFCYDEGLRVPLIIRVPEAWRHLLPLNPGTRVRDPASLLDLFPTFAAIANVAAPLHLHGVPLLGEARETREFAFSGRGRMDEHQDMTRTVRSSRYRYIRNYSPHRIWGQHYAFAWESPAYKDYEAAYLGGTLSAVEQRFWRTKPAEELYDMQADPDAVHNLAGAPEHRAVLNTMRTALDTHMLSIHDCGFLPEGSADAPWAMSRDPAHYPLADLMALAARAIRRDPTEADNFLAGLAHDAMPMRFWAAQGLLMLAVAGHPLPTATAAALEQEPDPYVRIPLLEALGHAGSPNASIAKLTEIVANMEEPRLRLQAVCALTWLPLRPDLSLDVITAAAGDVDEYIRGAAEYLRLRLINQYVPTSNVFKFDLYSGGAQAGMAHASRS